MIGEIIRRFGIWRYAGFDRVESVALVLLSYDMPGFAKFLANRNIHMRKELAIQGYDLDKLYRDTEPSVRRAVAGHGVYLDALIRDPDPRVRHEVVLYREHYLSLQEDILEVLELADV